MRIARLHVDQALQADTVVAVAGEPAHYLVNVLRLKPGMHCTVFNSGDGEFAATVESTGRQELKLALGESIVCSANPTLKIHLGMGLSRGERMDYAIQKSTELGVSEITPIFSARCEVKLSGDRLGNRLQHWRKIAINACEQCGRTLVPVINSPMPLADWLVSNPAGIVLDPEGDTAIDMLEIKNAVSVLTGPEGGLTDSELQLAVTHGYRKLKIGPRVLRTETAPLVVLSLLQFCYGDF
ncbi:MAG: 16S rRNA (uracil(1498)-N(3))-methyltransferase [Pseudohongiellaceae bacterium]